MKQKQENLFKFQILSRGFGHYAVGLVFLLLTAVFLPAGHGQQKKAPPSVKAKAVKAQEVAPGIFVPKGKVKVKESNSQPQMRADGKSLAQPVPIKAAQEVPAKKKAMPNFQPTLKAKDVIGSSLETKTEARTFTLTVPAPRGQIIDRNGYPLAQSRVAYYAAINFPQLKDTSDKDIARYALERVNKANQVLGGNWDLKYKTVLEHYKERRWLPLVFSTPLTEAQARKLKPELIKGLMLHPFYQRVYPQHSLASHIVGYVGRRPPRRTGPVEDGESVWPQAKGVDGLEAAFDEELTGKPGKINILFDSDGTKLTEEMIQRPKPGKTVVLALDLEIQMLAEEVLQEKTKSGAFVIMDVRTGDILAMASWPQYDPNIFIPAISQKDYSALQNDPAKPLFARAFRGAYPPASVFKTTVALATLEAGTVTEDTLFSCPTGLAIGDRVFHNWNKKGEGSMNVVGALTRSCNTWFYQAALKTGAAPITEMAMRLGYGKKTGLPLPAEAKGFVTSDRWSREKYGHPILDGDLANMAIGQGTVLASPLQVAQAMAAIGSRRRVVRPRLVLQIQDVNDSVTRTFRVRERIPLNIDPYNMEIVVQGMVDVVNAGNGTARRARNEHITVAGKTGTGQWKPHLEQNVAWFSGFAPADYPIFAFAAVYEGTPGERVGGGKNAGPIVGAFFEKYLKDEERLAEFKSQVEDIELAHNDQGIVRPEITGSIFKNTSSRDRARKAVNEVKAIEKADSGGLLKWFRGFRKRN
ncbi:MAG: penicillin-binding protein 2 [Verrucomicrobiales bacterium]|nr:penicillin-binding protein 2 [Verrucomicrobiales bacterium]